MTADAPTLPGPLDIVDLWLGLVLAIVAGLGIVRAGTAWLRFTIGRRWLLAGKLRRLATGARLEHFTSELGSPAFGGSVRTWVFPEVYVTAHVEDEIVVAYAITTRRWGFRPLLRPTGLGRVRLGTSTFEQITGNGGKPVGNFGANRWGYAEAIWLGNPGLYRQFAVAVNDAGHVRHLSGALDLARSADEMYATDQMYTPAVVGQLRRKVRVNTLCVSAPHVSIDGLMNGLTYGVDYSQVRVLEDGMPRWQHVFGRIRSSYLQRRLDKQLGNRNEPIDSLADNEKTGAP
jgi:hypothetical protein